MCRAAGESLKIYLVSKRNVLSAVTAIAVIISLWLFVSERESLSLQESGGFHALETLTAEGGELTEENLPLASRNRGQSSANVSGIGKESGSSNRENMFAEQKHKHKGDESAELASQPEPTESEKAMYLELPAWQDLFNENGTPKDKVGRNGLRRANGIPDFVDLYDGIEATFLDEVISNGVATDMSAYLDHENLSEQVLYNGLVNPTHDLGYSWFMAARDGEGGLNHFAAVERLARPGKTFVEFEFNQEAIRIGSGNPWWPLLGARSIGDISVLMDFSGGLLKSVNIREWNGDQYEQVIALPGIGSAGCHRQSYIIYCLRKPFVKMVERQVWTENFEIVKPTPPEQFVELGISTSRLLQSRASYGGLAIRTPEDIVLTVLRGPSRNIEEVAMQANRTGIPMIYRF